MNPTTQYNRKDVEDGSIVAFGIDLVQSLSYSFHVIIRKLHYHFAEVSPNMDHYQAIYISISTALIT